MFQLKLREWNDDQLIASLLTLKQTNPDLIVTVAVGGWNFGTDRFTAVCKDEATMKVRSLVVLDTKKANWIQFQTFVTWRLQHNWCSSVFKLIAQHNSDLSGLKRTYPTAYFPEQGRSQRGSGLPLIEKIAKRWELSAPIALNLQYW